MVKGDMQHHARLNSILAMISERDTPPNEGMHDLADRRRDIEKAAQLLIEYYGDAALERARSLEMRSEVSLFARSVREAVEAMSHEERAKRRPIRG